jgi:tetratricopeptide (TPR) repeat protein
MVTHGESSQHLFLMGLSYHHDAQYSQAVQWFEMASTYPQAEMYAPTWHFLGWSYFYMGQLEASKYAFEQFLTLRPDEADSLFALGLIATEENKLDLAIMHFNDSIAASELEPLLQAKAKARLADVLAIMSQWDEAILLYEESVTQNPDLYEAWYRLSRALRRVGRDDEATLANQQFEESKSRVRPDLQAQTRFPE